MKNKNPRFEPSVSEALSDAATLTFVAAVVSCLTIVPALLLVLLAYFVNPWLVVVFFICVYGFFYMYSMNWQSNKGTTLVQEISYRMMTQDDRIEREKARKERWLKLRASMRESDSTSFKQMLGLVGDAIQGKEVSHETLDAVRKRMDETDAHIKQELPAILDTTNTREHQIINYVQKFQDNADKMSFKQLFHSLGLLIWYVAILHKSIPEEKLAILEVPPNEEETSKLEDTNDFQQ